MVAAAVVLLAVPSPCGSHLHRCKTRIEVHIVGSSSHSSGLDLGYLHKGSFFGEVTALGMGGGANGDINKRTVTAVRDCNLSYIGADDIVELCKKHPVLQVTMMRHLCRGQFCSIWIFCT
eukprot:SAG11_NODE_4163_length_2030_cov_1.321595_5_plen_119_part_01